MFYKKIVYFYKMYKNALVVKSFFILVLALGMSISCQKKLLEPSWNTKVITPIAFSSMKVRELIKNSSGVSTDQNQLLNFVYTDTVYTLDNPLNSLVELSITPIKRVVNLESLKLEDQNIQNKTVLGSLINQIPSGFPKPSDGSSINPFTLSFLNLALAGAGASALGSNIDLSTFLQEAYIKQALFDLSITNQTNFDIINLKYQIKNTETGEVLVDGTILKVPSKQTIPEPTIDLANQILDKPIRGKLTVSFGGFSLALPSGKTSAVLNYTDYLEFSAKLYDIKVTKAKAQFPAQEIIRNNDNNTFTAENNVQLKFAKIEEGYAYVKGWSTIPVDINVDYSSPNIKTKEGEDFSFKTVIDNKFNTELNAKEVNYYFNDFNFNFEVPTASPPLEFNSFNSTIIGDIDATNGILSISLEDEINVEIGMGKLLPSYARGYLGELNEKVVETIPIDIFKNTNGTINFDKVNLQLEIVNEIGVNARLKIKTLKSRNSKTGKTATYIGDLSDFNILPAKENGSTFSATTSILNLGNAANLLSILPDFIEIDMELTLNPEGNDKQFKDFIHKEASIKAFIAVNIPFVASVEGLSVQDTSAVDFSTLEVPNGLSNGVLSVVIDNGLPIDANLEVYFIDNQNVLVEKLSDNQIIKAAQLDFGTGKVTDKTKTVLRFDISKDKLDQLKAATKMVVKPTFDTKNKEVVKFYDYYTFDVQLLADFGYQVNKK